MHVTFTLFSLCVRSLEIRFLKMVSSAYTVIFSFSNADNSFAEKGFTRILLHDSSLCSLYKTQNKIIFHSSLLAPFVDSYYSPRGQHDRTPGRFYYRKFTEFGLNLGTVNT